MEEKLLENDKTELKSGLNDKLEKSVVAFLNSKTGGDIYIGIADDGTSIGIENIDKTILAVSDRRSFNLSENFLEVVFPFEEEYLNGINSTAKDKTDLSTPPVTDQVTPEVTPEVVTLIISVQGEMTRIEIQKLLGLKDEKHFRENYQQKSLKLGILEMTIPEKPNSRLQKYRLTQKGLELKKQLSDMKKKN